MKTVLILAAVVALAVAGTVPHKHEVELKSVDAHHIERQTKILYLLESIGQYRKDADWFKHGYEYDVEANIDNYTDKKAVEEFLMYYKSGFMPKYKTFSIFYDEMREEAIALFKLFYYAKDFETFYKTAAFARVHCNDGQFLYAYYIAIYQRPDTKTLVLPAPYEMFPQYFVNTKTFLKAYHTKMQHGDFDPAYAATHGIFHENGKYVFYSNYTSPWLTGSVEDKLSYFTEDIGMNSYYHYFQTLYPFWWDKNSISQFDQMRGDIFYFTYQQLIAQYYLNRLSNGLGEIPEFSWYKPIETGYYCQLSSYYPFFSRNEYYQINKVENDKYINYLSSYEQSFLYYLEQGHFKAYNQEIDLRKPEAINFVAKYWFTTVDLYEKMPKNYERFYEIIGLHLLSATPEPTDKYTIFPSALELYQTSLRDPMFYQFYARILNYFLQWKEYLEPYSYSQLHFEGVKINDVKTDKLVTFFEPYDFDVTNDIFHSVEEFKGNKPTLYTVRQPRLNHKHFTVTVDVKSDVATDAVFKFFLGPKYDSNGYPLNIEDNWMNFVELDWFVHKLTVGQNKIERHSTDFALFKEDSVSIMDLLKYFKQGKVPVDMSERFFYQPQRMMLPKGTKGGFPFQLYVVVYPHTALPKEMEEYKTYFPDMKPMSYPFDRPVHETYFKQPNIYHEDVFIYHEGELTANLYNVQEYYPNYKNQVPKH
ncbi:arylphorin subunit alpha-like [Leguminivora glycinivorella]|uniref:arylphorin subunit alpha-like n=1 Tax=Leguminivora glycinivorella TaxID=1035111 RepID=UPI00200EEB6F|nr:arylphorin subunit alpha-like [Leguminivora glycinivorella]